jgi:hypothetical protein
MSEMNLVYVVTNPAMPGLVKIGCTSKAEAKDRISQLYGTGVPVPFDLAFAVQVEYAEKVESALHTAFAPNRVNPKREFFRIDPEQAIAILRLFQKEDVTKEVDQQADSVDPESIAAGEQLRKRRPNMNFQEMGIPIGSILHFTQREFTVEVTGPKKVKLGDEEMSITSATRQIAETEYDLPPALYWTYEGKLLREIYENTYDSIE